MSGFSKRLFEALEKLNEMGQLLLVVNNLPKISENDKRDLKSLAIKKDPQMLRSLEKFKIDHNVDAIRLHWLSLINSKGVSETTVKPSLKLPTSLIQNKGLIETVKKVVNRPTNLIAIRESLGLHKQNPKDLMVRLKNAFKVKETLNLEEFAKVLLQIDETSEPWQIMLKNNNLTAFFSMLDENKDNKLTKHEVLNHLIILSGGTPEEKISAMFMIYDKEGDGLIAYNNIQEHLRCSYKISLLLNSAQKSKIHECEALALATTESIFSQIDTKDLKVISEAEYLSWFNKKELDEASITEKSLKIAARLEKTSSQINQLKLSIRRLTSKENLKEISEIKTSTGLGKVPVHDALRVFKQKSSSGFFSRQQFSNVISELVSKYNPKFETTSAFYSSVCSLFTRFDYDGNGVMDICELFCGLSLVCAGSLGDKIYTACHTFDESGDGKMQFSELQKYFKAVFRMVCPSDTNQLFPLNSLSKETTDNLFNSFSLTKDKSISFEQLKRWILRSRLKFY